MRPLVWFRSDLRIRDNHALARACDRADAGVVAAFVFSSEQWRDEHDWGPMKTDFVRRNVAELSEALAGRNIPLRILHVPRFGGIPQALTELADETGCDALFFNREYEVNERARDEAVETAFARAGKEVHAFTDQTLLTPGEVRTKEGNHYSVFTPFKKTCYRLFHQQGVPEPVETPKRQREIGVDADPVPDTVDGFDFDREHAARPDLWPAGEDHALSRLAAFVDGRLGDYKAKRDTPSVNGTSTLSPYLAAGVVSPRQCVAAAMEANGGRFDKGGKGPVHWISEVLWREFYKHFLIGFPRVSRNQPFRLETRAIDWSYDEDRFRAWCEGRTGYPIVDAAMRQLNQTGWMHNRLRMIVAMFLTKDLFIDWRWGERYFMQRLVDGDLASNNGGWQWSASTGADAAPYFRIYNPVSQSKRHDPDGRFIAKFLPELDGLTGDALHDPAEIPAEVRAKTGYPEPIVDHGKARDRVLKVFKSLNETRDPVEI